MSVSDPHDVTRVLEAAADGNEKAAAQLLPLVYQELRRLAAVRMSKTPPGHTLQPTALVHEAFLRIAGERDSRWDGRKHFFFAASRAMRDILVERARNRASLKRGGHLKRVDLAEIDPSTEPPPAEMLALDEALKKLESEDAEKARLVMLRFFTGLTNEETATVLGVSVPTVERRWRFARAWLRREIGGADSVRPADD